MAKDKGDKTQKREAGNRGQKGGGKKKTAAAKPEQSAKPIDYSPLFPMQPSKELAAIVGSQPLLHSEASRRVWMYVKAHRLQDPKDSLKIKPDDKLAAVVGKAALSTVELTQAVMKGLKKP